MSGSQSVGRALLSSVLFSLSLCFSPENSGCNLCQENALLLFAAHNFTRLELGISHEMSTLGLLRLYVSAILDWWIQMLLFSTFLFTRIQWSIINILLWFTFERDSSMEESCIQLTGQPLLIRTCWQLCWAAMFIPTQAPSLDDCNIRHPTGHCFSRSRICFL